MCSHGVRVRPPGTQGGPELTFEGPRRTLTVRPSCSHATGSHVLGWSVSELGSTFEPCHVSGCLEHAKTHRNRLVVVVFSQSIVQKSRSDPPSPLLFFSTKNNHVAGVAQVPCVVATPPQKGARACPHGVQHTMAIGTLLLGGQQSWPLLPE